MRILAIIHDASCVCSKKRVKEKGKESNDRGVEESEDRSIEGSNEEMFRRMFDSMSSVRRLFDSKDVQRIFK